jgi:hypothetical protein
VPETRARGRRDGQPVGGGLIQADVLDAQLSGGKERQDGEAAKRAALAELEGKGRG